MADAEDIGTLRVAAEDKGRIVDVVVSGCAYACCGKGWLRRDGYEQVYCGYVDNFQDPAGLDDGSFMLYSMGIGTISYVVAVRFDEVHDVQLR